VKRKHIIIILPTKITSAYAFEVGGSGLVSSSELTRFTSKHGILIYVTRYDHIEGILRAF